MKKKTTAATATKMKTRSSKPSKPARAACSKCGRVNTRPDGGDPDCRSAAACVARRKAAA